MKPPSFQARCTCSALPLPLGTAEICVHGSRRYRSPLTLEPLGPSDLPHGQPRRCWVSPPGAARSRRPSGRGPGSWSTLMVTPHGHASRWSMARASSALMPLLHRAQSESISLSIHTHRYPIVRAHRQLGSVHFAADCRYSCVLHAAVGHAEGDHGCASSRLSIAALDERTGGVASAHVRRTSPNLSLSGGESIGSSVSWNTAAQAADELPMSSTYKPNQPISFGLSIASPLLIAQALRLER